MELILNSSRMLVHRFNACTLQGMRSEVPEPEKDEPRIVPVNQMRPDFNQEIPELMPEIMEMEEDVRNEFDAERISKVKMPEVLKGVRKRAHKHFLAVMENMSLQQLANYQKEIETFPATSVICKATAYEVRDAFGAYILMTELRALDRLAPLDQKRGIGRRAYAFGFSDETVPQRIAAATNRLIRKGGHFL